MLKKILFGGENGLSTQANAGLTILRILAGISLMAAHGIGKMPPSDQFVQGAAGLGFPLPTVFAWAAGLSEFLGGLFLALGLFTRPAAFFIACTMATALFGAHANDPWARKELAAMFLGISTLFLLLGSNDWSVDKLIRK